VVDADCNFDLDETVDGVDELLASENLNVDLVQLRMFGKESFLIECPSWIPPIELIAEDRAIDDSLKDTTAILRQAESDVFSAALIASNSQINHREPQRWKRASNREDEYLSCRTGVEKPNWLNPLVRTQQSDCSIGKVMAIISGNEGSTETINWNDNGCGISVGAFQANQKYGEFPLLLAKMQRADPKLFDEIFGHNFANIVKHQPQVIRRVKFIDEQHMGPNQLGAKLQEALKEPVFKQAQLMMLREKILQSQQVAFKFGIYSEKGVALVADMINQLGLGDDTCGARHYLRYALGKQNEIAKLEAIVEHDYQRDGRSRRDRKILTNATLSAEHPFKS
jgi:hypothetical protein